MRIRLPVEKLAQTNRPDGHAPEVLGAIADGAGNFGRAPADVDDQRAEVGGLALQDAEADEAGLLPSGDHLELEPRFAERALHDLVAVARLADRAGGHGAHARMEPVAQRAVAPEGGHEPVSHLPRNRAGTEDALPGSKRIAFLVQELQGPVWQGPGQLEPHRVGADVDGC